jgi:hypothetical protein
MLDEPIYGYANRRFYLYFPGYRRVFLTIIIPG